MLITNCIVTRLKHGCYYKFLFLFKFNCALNILYTAVVPFEYWQGAHLHSSFSYVLLVCHKTWHYSISLKSKYNAIKDKKYLNWLYCDIFIKKIKWHHWYTVFYKLSFNNINHVPINVNDKTTRTMKTTVITITHLLRLTDIDNITLEWIDKNI